MLDIHAKGVFAFAVMLVTDGGAIDAASIDRMADFCTAGDNRWAA